MRKFCGKGIFREIWKNRYVVLKGDQLYISEKEVGSVSFSSPFPPFFPLHMKSAASPEPPAAARGRDRTPPYKTSPCPRAFCPQEQGNSRGSPAAGNVPLLQAGAWGSLWGLREI